MKRVVILLVLLILVVPASAVDIKEIFQITPQETLEEDSPEISYFYVGDGLIGIKKDGLIKYNYQDRLGGDAESKQLPFGQELIDSDNRFEFTGKELDDESGLNYFGVRYYDSDVGKFTSTDPIKDNHAYNYVANNPMNYIDPEGMDLVFHTSNRLPYKGSGIDPDIGMPKEEMVDLLVSKINEFFGEEVFKVDRKWYNFADIAPDKLVPTDAAKDYSGSANQNELFAMLMDLIGSDTDTDVYFFSGDSFYSQPNAFSRDVALMIDPAFAGTVRPLAEEGNDYIFSLLGLFFHEAGHGHEKVARLKLTVSEGDEVYAVQRENQYNEEVGNTIREYYTGFVYQDSLYVLTPEQYNFAKFKSIHANVPILESILYDGETFYRPPEEQ